VTVDHAVRIYEDATSDFELRSCGLIFSDVDFYTGFKIGCFADIERRRVSVDEFILKLEIIEDLGATFF
jgi:hypothetical protein